jgi:ketosteroid isomerase-like protein
MKRLLSAIAGLALIRTVVASAAPDAGDAAPEDAGSGSGLEEFLRRCEAANTAFVNGDPEPWLELTAENDPASVFGGFGGLGEAGIAGVHQRYRRAATAFCPSGAQVTFQYLVRDVRGTLAYTVAIERATVLYAGRTKRQPQALRVTMVYRFDRGDWRIVHRHADPMVDLRLPF